MTGANKILTVSYGTFSCTLEGFDEPFDTMRAIAEYFRDLAAEDRFFGAEPPVPDADTIARIAESRAQRRVEARVRDTGIDLRLRPAEPPVTAPAPVAPAPVAPAPVAAAPAAPAALAPDARGEEPLSAEVIESVAEKLKRIRQAVAESRAAPPLAAGFAAGVTVLDEEVEAAILPDPAPEAAQPTEAEVQAEAADVAPEAVAPETADADAAEPESDAAEAGTAETAAENAADAASDEPAEDETTAEEPAAAIAEETARAPEPEEFVEASADAVEEDDAEAADLTEEAEADGAAFEAAGKDADAVPAEDIDEVTDVGEETGPEALAEAGAAEAEIEEEAAEAAPEAVELAAPESAVEEVAAEETADDEAEAIIARIAALKAEVLGAAPGAEAPVEPAQEETGLDDLANDLPAAIVAEEDVIEVLGAASPEADEAAEDTDDDAAGPDLAAEAAEPDLEGLAAALAETEAKADWQDEDETVAAGEADEREQADAGETTPLAVADGMEDAAADLWQQPDDAALHDAATDESAEAEVAEAVLSPEEAESEPEVATGVEDDGEAEIAAEAAGEDAVATDEAEAPAEALLLAEEDRVDPETEGAADEAAREEPLPEPVLFDATPVRPMTLLQRARARFFGFGRNRDAVTPKPAAETAAAEEPLPVLVLGPEQAAETDPEALRIAAEVALAVAETEARSARAEAAAAEAEAADAEGLPEAEAEAEAEAGAEALPAPQPAQPAGFARRAEDAEVERIIDKTNTEMSGPESRRRQSAISHLKAAVAATEADRDGRAVPATPVPAISDAQFREDLSQAIRPRRPVITGEAGRARPEDTRPDPFVLGHAQRIDRTRPEAAVQPRRVSTRNLLRDEYDPEEEDFDDTTPSTAEALEASRNFADFAERMGANNLPELLEAAAAYTSAVEGHAYFSRPQILQKVARIADDGDFTREESLRSFGMLLRQGKIQKIRRGQFVIASTSKFMAEARRAQI